MSVGPFDTLAAVREFLNKDVSPTVPQEMASEMRAVVKLLQDVADELDWLPAVLNAECEEILSLQARARELIGPEIGGEPRQWIVTPASSISEQIELHRSLSEMAANIMLKLQAQIRELSGRDDATGQYALLDQYYETLGRHAETRLRWQSVFDGKQNKTSPVRIAE